MPRPHREHGIVPQLHILTIRMVLVGSSSMMLSGRGGPLYVTALSVLEEEIDLFEEIATELFNGLKIK